MVIDIISYTEEQLAALSEEQILEVKTAQQKKNELAVKVQENKDAFKRKLVENGTFLSHVWPLICQKYDEEYTQQVNALRDALLFYLHYTSRSSAATEKYPIDYALSVEERFYDVRDYYDTTYADPQERFEAFKADSVARLYLGELYAPLYDYFYMATL